jgi:hypothetical protein
MLEAKRKDLALFELRRAGAEPRRGGRAGVRDHPPRSTFLGERSVAP